MAVSLVSTGVQFPDSTIQTTAATAGGKAINVQTFTSSGTWTKPSGYGSSARVLIQCWGGGGSGGSQNTNNGYAAGGGGGGGYNYRWIALSSLGATETVTIGAGGTGVSGQNAGNDGGTTSFGSTVFAYGGGAGGSNNVGSDNQFRGGGGGGQLSTGRAGGKTPNGNTTWSGAAGRPGNATIQAQLYAQAGQVYMYIEGMGGGGGLQNGVVPAGSDGYYKGGGGGGSNDAGSGNAGYAGAGGASVWGGGGGGSATWDWTSTSAAGVSQYGGNGGIGAFNTTAASGVQPGGGGGGHAGSAGSSGSGGAGQCIVTVFDGV